MTDKQTTPPTPGLNRLMWRWAAVLLVLAAFALWATWRMSSAAARLPQLAGSAPPAHAQPQIEYWTCTMHPEVKQPDPGDCPICGMKLVPKYAGRDEPGVAPTPTAHVRHAGAPAEKPRMWYRCTMPECGDVGSDDPESRCPVCGMKREPVGMIGPADTADYQITLSERAQRLAAVATEPVQKRYLFKRVRTVGKIGYDETRHKVVSAWTAGRIDQLFADFTGMVVSKGDHLVRIYSPELLSAQEEYLQALRASDSIRDSRIEASRRSAEQLVRSARGKLELLGITPVQIEALEQFNTPQTHLVVYAPLGGTIVHKRAVEGMYVKTGDLLYEIADLTQVWLLLDVYEADLPWIQPFQNVLVTAQALPGLQFHGQIAFVDPVVDKMTRTVKVRVNVGNPERRLKPEMFVTAQIVAPMGPDGRAVAPPAAGTYACPMHPWETAVPHAAGSDSDRAPRCPICEMPMVPLTSIPGYTPPGEPEEVLSVARAAVLQTGQRSLAYVEVAPGSYRGVEVSVGPLAQVETGEEYYLVLDGLQEGQNVVTRGNFAIDSQMQIAGKPSLLQPRYEAGQAAEHHAAAAMDVSPVAEQTTCPVMVGNAIDKEVFVDYKGVRIYFCCRGCDKKFLADPEQYIPRLPASVQTAIRQGSATPAEPPSPATSAQEEHSHD